MPKIGKSTAILESLFFAKFRENDRRVEFTRDELLFHVEQLGIERPKNLGGLIYDYRYKEAVAPKIRSQAPDGWFWVLYGAGNGKYAFELSTLSYIRPSGGIEPIEILDSTPGLVAQNALNDEQALLAKLRYNRLIDTFTSSTCYSLQNHLRTQLDDVGQVETDEIYIGIDTFGNKQILPIQAKGKTDTLNVVQIHQDLGICAEKFPGMKCRPLAAQFMPNGTIAIFEFSKNSEGIKIERELHYKLVPIA